MSECLVCKGYCDYDAIGWRARYCSQNCLFQVETAYVQDILKKHNATLASWGALDEELDNTGYALEAARLLYWRGKNG